MAMTVSMLVAAYGRPAVVAALRAYYRDMEWTVHRGATPWRSVEAYVDGMMRDDGLRRFTSLHARAAYTRHMALVRMGVILSPRSYYSE